MAFENKWEAFAWMFKKQLGRRNLSSEQRDYLMGKRNEAEKMAVGTNRYSQKEEVQNGPLKAKGKTAQRIAEEYGVGYGTVIRAEKFAKGIDALRESNPEAADAVLKGNSGATKAEIAELPNKTTEGRFQKSNNSTNGDTGKKLYNTSFSFVLSVLHEFFYYVF